MLSGEYRRVLLIAVCAAASFGIVGCAENVPTATSSPERIAAEIEAIPDTVRRYFDAYNAGDVDELNATSCSSAQREVAVPPTLETVVDDIGVPTVTGDVATVPVTMAIGTGPLSTVTLSLVREDGMWTFCMSEHPSDG
ncbi:hypothetical protein [Rhodococcus sovatensis]|uniref:DUF4878 domain-containing protein n=1 Tax=Rhodococcus sovatensis TaxID=1805840 RepID=A0ABZ2PKG7_9NOCA